MKFQKVITFDDVLLQPQYSEIESRSTISTDTSIRDLSFSIPVISSPMDTITERQMIYALDKLGGLGIVHRYNTIPEQAKIVHSAHADGAQNIGAAIQSCLAICC